MRSDTHTEGPVPESSPFGPLHQLILIVVLCAVFFWRILLAGSEKLIAGYDIIVYHYYARAFTRESLLNGLLPKWNPYDYAGMPFAADPGNCVFYPLNKFFLFMPISKAISINVALHVAIAGIGMLLFARRIGLRRGGSLVAATVFMLSGYFIDRIGSGHEILVMCSAYIPWIFLCHEWASQTRRITIPCVCGGILASLQVLTGASQPVLYTWLFLLAYVLAKSVHADPGNRIRFLIRDCLCLALIGVICVGLSAIQLLPTLELVARSARAETTLDFVRSYSFPPRNFLHFILPYLDVGKAVTNWEYTCYVGIFPLAMSMAALVAVRMKKTLPFVGVTIMALAIMLARHNPLFPVMARVIPGLAWFRVHARAEIGLIFAIAALAGIGWEELFYSQNATKDKLLKRMVILFSASFLIIASGVILLFVSGSLSIHYQSPFPGRIFGELIDRGQTIRSLLHPRFLLALSILIVTFLASLTLLTKPGRHLRIALIALIIADLFMMNSGRIHMIDREYVTRVDKFVDLIRSDHANPYFRVWVPDRLLHGSRAKYFKIFSVNGYSSLMLGVFEEYLAHLTALSEIRNLSDYEMNPLIFSRMEPFATNLLGVKYYGYKPIDRPAPLVANKPDFFPRAHFVKNHVRGSPEQFLESRIDTGKIVFLHEDPPERGTGVAATAGQGKVTIDSYAADEIILSVDAPENGFVVLSEVHYPGWKAEVDDRPTKVLRGDYLLRVVPVPGGSHKLRVFFASGSLTAGIAITVFTLGGVLVAVLSPPALNRLRRSRIPDRSSEPEKAIETE